MALNIDNYDCEDVSVIKKQLKREKISICSVFKRCKYGFPQIIFLNPVKETGGLKEINFEAVSNLMWLTCPYLNHEIHELENALYVKKIKSIIQNDALFKEMMFAAHAYYYFFRNDFFRKLSAPVSEKEIDLFLSGIGGMRELNAIKCLHLHFCHYNLCRENIAGLITYHLLHKKTDCNDAYCAATTRTARRRRVLRGDDAYCAATTRTARRRRTLCGNDPRCIMHVIAD